MSVVYRSSTSSVGCLYSAPDQVISKQDYPFSVFLYTVCIRSINGWLRLFKKGSWDTFKLKQAGPEMHSISADVHSVSCLFSGHLLF